MQSGQAVAIVFPYHISVIHSACHLGFAAEVTRTDDYTALQSAVVEVTVDMYSGCLLLDAAKKPLYP